MIDQVVSNLAEAKEKEQPGNGHEPKSDGDHDKGDGGKSARS
jgi:hypothetical protein